jgi:hypothetical protein
MQEMSRYLLGVVAQSLRGGSPAHCPKFNCATECTQVLLEIYLDARYKSHDNSKLSCMKDALLRFNTFKELFSLRRAGKQAKAKANALRMELVTM